MYLLKIIISAIVIINKSNSRLSLLKLTKYAPKIAKKGSKRKNKACGDFITFRFMLMLIF